MYRIRWNCPYCDSHQIIVTDDSIESDLMMHCNTCDSGFTTDDMGYERIDDPSKPTTCFDCIHVIPDAEHCHESGHPEVQEFIDECNKDDFPDDMIHCPGFVPIDPSPLPSPML